jgi:hypothetical protein
MTKTICDRCGSEQNVSVLTLETAATSPRPVDLCARCHTALREFLQRIPEAVDG